jgi:hypothetical protein
MVDNENQKPVMEIKQGYPSPKYLRETKAYNEGFKAFNDHKSHTENPYPGSLDGTGWRWADGWLDAMQQRVLG